MNWDLTFQHLLGAALFGVVGILIFVVALKIIVKVSPFSIQKEIAEDQNVALGIVIGSIFVGLGIIVGCAIVG